MADADRRDAHDRATGLTAERPRCATASRSSLDVDDLVAALRLARELQPWFGVAKVGLELYSAVGPRRRRRRCSTSGYEVFVDLKLHDIPTTVEQAARVLGALGVALPHLARARRRRRCCGPASTGLAEGAADAGLPDADRARGHRAHERRRRAAAHPAASGSQAAVEARLRRHRVRRRPTSHEVTQLAPAPHDGRARHPPGRRADRTTRPASPTPGEALAAGADLLVIGRAVTQADDPGGRRGGAGRRRRR